MHKGKCLCGSVSFTVNAELESIGACHCSMCRRWGSAPWLGVHVEADALTYESDASLKVYTSSAWAERAFCSECGSAIFYRLTAGPAKGFLSFSAGLFESTEGVPFTSEIFIDDAAPGVAFAGERSRKTGAEVMAEFGG